MADNNYATRQDLQELRTHIDERFRHVDERFSHIDERFRHIDERFRDVDARFDQVIEATRDMQTEVLRAFHSWARPSEVKIRSHEERLTLLEERVSEIERGKTGS